MSIKQTIVVEMENLVNAKIAKDETKINMALGKMAVHKAKLSPDGQKYVDGIIHMIGTVESLDAYALGKILAEMSDKLDETGQYLAEKVDDKTNRGELKNRDYLQTSTDSIYKA